MPKTAIIFTGGTISMKIDRGMGAAVPALRGQDILGGVQGVDDITDVIIHNFGMYPGPHMTPKRMLELYRVILEYAQRDDVSGVVVTHGTDSMEETAWFIDCVYGGLKPVVFVGAMKNNSEMGYDGTANLYNAIRVAVDSRSRGYGVLVVMADEIHAARDVTKMHTDRLDTFRSPELGAVGVVDKDRVIYYRILRRLPVVKPQSISAKVALIKSATGMDGDFIRFCINRGYNGIVIEGMGRGNIPPAMADDVVVAIKKGIVVVLCSRCTEGRVLDSYGYLGGAYQLKQAGVILGGKFNGQKARIRVIAALSAGLDRESIRTLFLADEI